MPFQFNICLLKKAVWFYIVFTLIVTECCMFCGFKHPICRAVSLCLACHIQFNNLSTEFLLSILYFLSLRYCKKTHKKKLIVFIRFYCTKQTWNTWYKYGWLPTCYTHLRLKKKKKSKKNNNNYCIYWKISVLLLFSI